MSTDSDPAPPGLDPTKGAPGSDGFDPRLAWARQVTGEWATRITGQFRRVRGWRQLGRWREAPLWARLCVIIGALTAMTSGVVVTGSLVLSAYADNTVPQEPLLPPELRAQGHSIDGPLNILLLGMDQRTNSNDVIRADSIIIVHVNAAHDTVSLVSLPRDGRVQIPAYPQTGYSGGLAKLNEAFAAGNRTRPPGGGWVGDPTTAGRGRGVELMAKTIDQMVPGLRFNAVAIINFEGFNRVVQALGGIHLCVDERTVSDHFDVDGKYVGRTTDNGIKGYVYEKGCRDFQPWEALDFVRQRKHLELGDGDYGRQRHQQQFLFAVFKKLLSSETLTDAGKIGKLRDAAGDLLTVDLGGVSVLDWIFSLRDIRTDDITLVRTNGGQFATLKLGGVDYEEIKPETITLLEAVRDDQIPGFLITHPTWIAKPEG